MKVAVPMNVSELMAFAECLATMLAEVGLTVRGEAQLRADIAAAKFAITRHVALNAAAKHHPIAMGFLHEAEVKRDRSIARLRHRVKEVLSAFCPAGDDQFTRPGDLLATVAH
jgi:hypothetical protein